MSAWTSAAGIALADRVPAALRAGWVRRGLCPGHDLYTCFSQHVRDHPDREAVVDVDGSLDYAGLAAEVRRRAGELASAGVGDHDVVGIALPDDRTAVIAELAVYAVGAVALPCPPGHTDAPHRARASVLIDGGVRRLARTGGARTTTRIDAEAPARVLVSSGSEARPKLVAYSHNAFAGGRATYVRALRRSGRPMRNLVLVPLGSSFGSCGVPVTVAALGGTLLLPGTFDAGTAVRAASEWRATHVFGVPTMLGRMAAVPAAPLPALEAVVSSGAALPDAVARACADAFPCEVIAVYGSSDGVNCHTARTGLGPWTGKPDPAVTSIRIGDDGEILARGPMTPLCYVDPCYVDDPGLDARYRLPGGWVRTGDRGAFDDHGRLRVLGRLKQIVVRGGFNISPAEIEDHLGEHPGIAEVACVGVPDEDLGERLCACVAPRAGAPLTLPALTRFLAQDRGVDRRKLPEALVVLPELPLGATGKVCRRTLTEIASRGSMPRR
ncbi:class I adenylate-forming enzyme family protein [Amycolatopsis sp. CA-230715]|uniref:class I adenylate-forming enzyme family protein n=1 Tax=Amycolatopsis sp. CA-230715 TaxID=2745196 RepID=UPI001C0205DC|nr:class I adenylate-forming enzyme family protein [Amycolatopsis sp. CA-230715]QWF83855.1 Medium-chain fatty-acid--CoA ligase [Amycolatopsis sp. CA-230715]